MALRTDDVLSISYSLLLRLANQTRTVQVNLDFRLYVVYDVLQGTHQGKRPSMARYSLLTDRLGARLSRR